MSRFIQLHILTSYPPANLNRDDLGRPKTAKMGGTDRLRVSSQSLKRAWRTSEVFQTAMNGSMGKRTKLFGVEIFKYLIGKGASFETALQGAKAIAGVFGKNESPVNFKKKKDSDKELLHRKLKKKWKALDKENLGISDYSLEQLNELEAVEISQLSFISPDEITSAYTLADKVVAGEDITNSPDLLRKITSAVDIAMFGRMLADTPSMNIEAACQVAHAISVHTIAIEDDYFTAVDDLNDRSEDAGAAHIGETGFAAGLFYSYICINKELLVENLGGDTDKQAADDLADKAIAALTEAAVKVAPEGKQNSFASRAYASYVLAEVGDQQPRSLSVAFLKPVGKQAEDYAAEAINALQEQCQNFDSVYDKCADFRYWVDSTKPEGSLEELLAFLQNPLDKHKELEEVE